MFPKRKPSRPFFTLKNNAGKPLSVIENQNTSFCCQNLAFVDFLAKYDNRAICLLVRQDLFGRIVDAKKGWRMVCKKNAGSFSIRIKLMINARHFRFTRIQETPIISKKNAQLKKCCNFSLQWLELNVHLLNVPYDTSKKMLYCYVEEIWSEQFERLAKIVEVLDDRTKFKTAAISVL